MKKFAFLLFSCLTALSISAANPVLPLMQAFDGRYNDRKGVEISEIRQPNNYYYSIKVIDDDEIIGQLLEWGAATEKIAEMVNTNITDGDRNIILNVAGDDIINIGIFYPTDKKQIRVFLQSVNPILPSPGMRK